MEERIAFKKYTVGFILTKICRFYFETRKDMNPKRDGPTGI